MSNNFDTMDFKLFQNIGMSTKELEIYLKLLEMGVCAASTLASKIGQKRTSVYSMLNNMQDKGFITYILKNKVKYYSAVDPRILVNMYIENGNILSSILPQLLALQNVHEQKPKITFYEGVEGIKQICETLLEVPGSIRESFMGINEQSIHPEIKRYFEEEFIARRIELGQSFRGIVTGYVPFSETHPHDDKGQKREVKVVDAKNFPIQIQIDIYPNNKVSLYSYDQDVMMGVVIEHEAFYNTMKTVFKLAWNGC